MKLTDAKLRTLAETGKNFDGGGLYLELTKAGGRYWRLKYRHSGKEKRLAFGVYPEVGLKAARELTTAARQTLHSGRDPGEQRKAKKIKVSLHCENGGLVLCVIDNGLGFDVKAAEKRALAGECSGLQGMAERATLLGGRLSVKSKMGDGTRVRAEFSISEGA